MTQAIMPLADFIPALSPKFMKPNHLKPLTDIFQRIAQGERVRAVVSVPPRHFKTETLLHSIPWFLLQDPEMQIGYASYAARIAEKKSRRARELSRKAGVPLSPDAKSRADWRTGEGEGGVWATSVDGAVTGEGFNLVLLDDLCKGRAESESGATRDRINAWLTSDILTRVEPRGAVLLSMARWHPNDPAGTMIGAGWEHVNLPALDANDQPLCPERWPASELVQLREALGGKGGYEWESLYQGNPRGRGARVFDDVHFYDVKPNLDRVSIGVDFAYSTRTASDFSVAVVLAEMGGTCYVVDVVRVHDEPRQFRERVKLLCATYPSASVTAYAAATERGGIEFFRDGGIDIDGRTASGATGDKFSRAIPTVAAWNQGRILLPRSAPWLSAFVSEVCGFTGTKKDRNDDIVDSLAAAFSGIQSAPDNYVRARVWCNGTGGDPDFTPVGLDGGYSGGPSPWDRIDRHFTSNGCVRLS